MDINFGQSAVSALIGGGIALGIKILVDWIKNPSEKARQEEDVKRLNEALDKLEKDLTREIKEINSKLDSVIKSLLAEYTRREAVEKITDKVNSLDVRLSTVEASVENHEGNLTDLIPRVSKMEGRYESTNR
jgi:predicted RNase H-like nuclease (RuvC/YqgF family)